MTTTHTHRVAYITGGMGGIGTALCRRLCTEGHTVIAGCGPGSPRREKWIRDMTDQGYKVICSEGNVADWESTRRAFEIARAEVGPIDILVNNAGIAGKNVPTVDYPIEEWDRVLRVNLTSQFLCCRAVAPHMVKAGYGRIVNIASIAGKEGNPNAVAYSASKAGVISLTKSLGKELAQSGVLVNCVTPAAAKTAIFDQMTETHIQYMLSKIPLGRFVHVEEIAALVCWLASADCSFSTGAVFDISGGRATY